MAVLFLLDVVYILQKRFISCWMFRRPCHLASISNLLAIRKLSSGEIFWKLSVDDWLEREKERTEPIEEVLNLNLAWIYYEFTEGVVLLLRLQLHCVKFKLSLAFSMPHFPKTTREIGHNIVGKIYSWDPNKWPAETFFPRWARWLALKSGFHRVVQCVAHSEPSLCVFHCRMLWIFFLITTLSPWVSGLVENAEQPSSRMVSLDVSDSWESKSG